MIYDKEEAIRAKEIAEKKMQTKDFVGARRIALKAQRLHPELENILQMLIVCDIHCSAEHKILGSEMDWYGILQITQTADEASIKKQYQKFSALLHPDKNKFAGGEAAFKLIGEAQRVLTDQQKRNLYDMKCGHLMGSATPKLPRQPVNRSSSVRKPSGAHNNFMNTTSQPFTGLNMHQQQQKQDPPDILWTDCPFCGLRNQYYRFVFNGSLCCLGCKRPFMALDMNGRGPSVGINGNNSAFSQQQGVLGQGARVRSQSTAGNPPSDVGSKGTFGTGSAEPQTFPKMGSTPDVGRNSKCLGKEDGNTTSQNMHQQLQEQDPPDIFWTVCPFCGLRNQYYRFVLNSSLHCRCCKRPFVAFDMNAWGPSVGVNGNKSAFSQQGVPGQGVKVRSQSTSGNPPSDVRSRGTFGTGTAEPQTSPKMGSTSDVGRNSKCSGKEDGNVDMGVGEESKRRSKNHKKPEESEPSGNTSKKRPRK